MLFQPSQAKPFHCRLSPKHQQGVVIVVALFIVALVATMAYGMMTRLERDTRRTSLILRDTQAEFYAQGSIIWALDQLRSNWEKQKPNQVVDPLPIRSPVIDVNGYKITSTIYDMQGRFNLNNLVNTDAQADFKRLLQTVDPKLSEEKRQQIVKGIVDWITPGQQHNEFNQFYLELAAPYRAAHRPFFSISELRLVKGVTPALFNALQPYITALPVATLVNIQTAPAPVLMTLSPTLTLDTARAIEQVRARTPIVTAQQFIELDIVKNHHIAADKITVKSGYFLIETTVAIEKQQALLYTLVERTAKDNKAKMTLLWQSKGEW
ncbi:type II secretion system minor pseudopilin GspK [Aquicella lusitana]|uniref:Type II secretion system protein K n=1 Tax=Aquicella lusitana TaxID=254246 RepID=A0A370G2G2_9COXI|nr:type II secretion system minor pseudopilin GspK [Aquicella lusitana]RDI38061.1 general secretion pathway protein K [Aquicella lusitana]VVC72639.1 hypothetical protein AQULUS_03530 [Aquicella lusitana]